MLHRRSLLIPFLAAALLVAVLILDRVQPFAYTRLCWLYRDAVSRAGRTTAPNPNLVFLALDAASVSLDETDIDEVFGLAGDSSGNSRALRLMSKRFPWSREVYGLILDRLVQAGARAVAFDLTFPGPTDDDPKFRALLDRYRDHVIIGSNFVDGSLTRPSETLVPQTSPIDNRVAYTNFWSDEDDVVRRAQYRVTFDQIRGTESKKSSEEFLSLASTILVKAGFGDKVPRDLANHAFRFTAPPGQGFEPHSLFEIFVPTFWQQNYQSGKFFQNKIVIVGADGNWQHDDHPTPFGRMAGAELHLNAVNAALHQEFIGEISPAARIAVFALAAIAAVCLSLVVRSAWARMICLALLCGAAVALAVAVFNRTSVFLPLVGPLGQLASTVLIGLACDFTTERFERKRLRQTLERYVSRDVVREVVDRPNEYANSLGGVVKPVTILFSDIRSYSDVTAKTPPQHLVAQLNEYFTAMVECVFESGGTLDKFIGDAIMALWGSLGSTDARANAVAAVNAALAMRQRLALLNQTWRERGWPQLRVGMGVNHGKVVVGNIGSPRRMEFTVIGDAVNTSWKLQELTKQASVDLLISEAVRELAGDQISMREVGAWPIPGISLPLNVYTVASAEIVFESGKQPPAPPIPTRSWPQPISSSPATAKAE